MNRRHFLNTSALAGAACLTSAAAPAAPPPRAPFKLLYSNDTTNILSCVSPFHKAREPFRGTMVQATVDEVADKGVDVHMLQPGLGMVPMWPSKVLPLDQHYAWMKERYGQKPDSYGGFVLNGGDIVKLFVDRCRERGQSPFISFRLNDAHHKEYADTPKGEKLTQQMGMSVTRFYVEHPEMRLKPQSTRGSDVVQNWAFPEVRAQKFALIQELCENYDLDGLELDFMRFYSFFQLDKTTSEQRVQIVSGSVKEVRALLDRTAREGRRRWLCIRIPLYIKAHDALGLDLPALAAAGVDMLNLSASYFTVQQTDLAAIRKQLPDTAIYLELCHSIWNGDKLTAGYDTFTFRRATAEQLLTTAHLALAQGCDGVSLFNFAYYREHGSAGRGPFSEPPFDLLPKLRDRAALAASPQHWFLAPGWGNPFIRPPMLPCTINPGKPKGFTLDMAPPKGGWKFEGRLRIQTIEDLPPGEWTATLNGQALQASAEVSEPYPNPSPSLLGRPAQMRAWQVPAALLKDGANRVEFTFTGPAPAEPIRLSYLDLAVS